jgi:hypothetical protein
MQSIRSLAAALCAVALASCGDKTVQDITAPAPGAAVKFFNFGINAPSVNFYANDTKATAISATTCTPATDARCTTTGIESTTGTAYGAVGAGGLYVGLQPGPYTLTGRISAATDNGVSISSAASTLDAGKYYSYYISGAYDAGTKKAEAFVVEDPIPSPLDPSRAYVRLVNAIPNAAPMVLFAKSIASGVEGAIGGAVSYKSAGAFVAVAPDVYDLNTRATGSATNLITRTGVSFAAGRVYTISARGDMTVTSSSATNRPILDNTANR